MALQSFPTPVIWKGGRVSSERTHSLETVPRPDATDGILAVPLKGAEYSFIHGYSLMYSYSVNGMCILLKTDHWKDVAKDRGRS